MEESDPPHLLPLLAQKHLSHAIQSDTAAFCNIHDLLAVINTTTDDVTVYRTIHGQQAFTVKFPDPYEEAKPCLLSWKADGSVLGVGWDDGSCCLYSGEDGKLISRLKAGKTAGHDADWKLDLIPHAGRDDDEATDGPRAPTSIAWTMHQRPGKVVKAPSRSDKTNGELTTEDWFNGSDLGSDVEATAKTSAKDGIKDLIDSIVTLDVTRVIPTLSALPSHGLRNATEAAKFSTQPSTDATFKSSTSNPTGIDTLLLTDTNGRITVYLDDTVHLGTLPARPQTTHHASHPLSASQVLLSQSPDTIDLFWIDLPLSTLSSATLSTIATNTKNLQNLTTYITHTIRCIQHDYTTGLTLPTRLLNNLTEDLAAANPGDDAKTALYDLLLSGTFSPTITEWLSDIIKDTNRKRWEQAVTEMYDNVQTHLFAHLAPALTRMQIAASALRGLARMHEGTSTFDVAPELLTGIIDHADAVRLAGEKVLLVCGAELRQFRAFIRWIRVMVEVATAGPGSKGAIEVEGRDVGGLDMGSAGGYIVAVLGESGMKDYLEQMEGMKGSVGREEFFEHAIIGGLRRQDTIAALQRMQQRSSAAEGENADMVATAAVNLPALTARLNAQIRLTLEAITKWQQSVLSQRSQPTQTHFEISLQPGYRVLDLHMTPATADTESTAHILHLGQQETSDIHSTLHLHSISRCLIRGSTTPLEEHVHDIPLDKGAEVKHAQILTLSSHERPIVLALLHYQPLDIYELLLYTLPSSQSRSTEGARVLQTFAADTAFKPERFIVGGRAGKKVVVVFAGGGKGWMVLDLEAGLSDGGTVMM